METPSRRLIFEIRKLSDRIAIALASIFIFVLLGGSFIAVKWTFKGSQLDSVDRFADQLIEAVARESLGTCLLFSATMFVHAAFCPAWTRRLLQFSARHAWQAIRLFLTSMVGIAAFLILAH